MESICDAQSREDGDMVTIFRQTKKGKGGKKIKAIYLSPSVERTRSPELNLKRGTFQSNVKKNFPSAPTAKVLDSCQNSIAFLQHPLLN